MPKKIALLASGSSLNILSENIEKFKDKDWLWGSLNNFVPNENVIRKIGLSLDFLYMSDWTDLDIRFEQHSEFFKRMNPKTFITSMEYWTRFTEKWGGYLYKNNLVISSYAEGRNADPQQSYNSLTAYLLTLIALDHRNFILFGADGGGDYFDEATENRADFRTPERVQKNLMEDTGNMNRIFWREVKSITPDHITILNVGMESKLECFSKITIEEAWGL